jgi:hypothetical protein
VDVQAQGWYRDPYRLHEDRYFSAGSPTKLVRDNGSESYDPPPDEPLPGYLTPVAHIEDELADGADMLRVDRAAEVQPTAASLRGQYKRALMDYFDARPKQ